MIICPTCKEEIDDDSRYCDQCGQKLVYCSSCGRVGKGRRCTYCGGLMVTVEELESNRHTVNTSMGAYSQFEHTTNPGSFESDSLRSMMADPHHAIPRLALYNGNLDIHIVGQNGAMIGRRQGPYTQFFQDNMYVSGLHAQLVYTKESGWCIIDKHSSNGTMLNDHHLQPDVPMSIKSGDIVTIANISLQVSIG